MALSAFDDPEEPPDAAQVRAVLGATAPLWGRVVEGVTAGHGPVASRWNFASAKFGWSMRIQQGDRVVLYLTPCEGHFLAGLALGEKAVAAARDAGLPPDVEAAVDASPKYAEGRGVRLPVRSAGDVAAVLTLVGAKLATTGSGARARRARR